MFSYLPEKSLRRFEIDCKTKLYGHNSIECEVKNCFEIRERRIRISSKNLSIYSVGIRIFFLKSNGICGELKRFQLKINEGKHVEPQATCFLQFP
ncbi:hypothetical protein NPIL_68901 [Nephila pilipes]|uniref:Uncharacterized protein n=1 Tax=Nephila pilipes TaxID=299642 RepID=A0A8X6MV14_NEPPI|nr:hypothetical protein NPIL_68901 [Nephila pilipes]